VKAYQLLLQKGTSPHLALLRVVNWSWKTRGYSGIYDEIVETGALGGQ